jgi:transcriptional regulator with XRE-family HTH domain
MAVKEKKERRRRQGSKAPSPGAAKKSRRMVKSPARAKSAIALYGATRFQEIRQYFRSDLEVARALGWDPATVSQWRRGEVVRPSRRKIRQVELLGRLAEETNPYLSDPLDVGSWIAAPQPYLGGKAPGRWVDERGEAGLRQLVSSLVDWMPRLAQGELEPVDPQEADAALEAYAAVDEGSQEFKKFLSELS